ncbi:hypothetical protein OZ411_41395 [Bradyrhizobium sp. Arg237L]|uniref:hypothetical protein n=1 Tax=Bradyrhizobium sp. Arg237L TaxID=3003352 RepID=UPI00249DB4CA|nr:hypothetical protein [Bradyrhizobium sp. Arg237L]MDI4239251.1 hypothetical protein [Bradyrhizobium sp. Arg237L]
MGWSTGFVSHPRTMRLIHNWSADGLIGPVVFSVTGLLLDGAAMLAQAGDRYPSAFGLGLILVAPAVAALAALRVHGRRD